MSFPSSPPALPAIVARFAVGRPVRAVWVNELGGVTFRVDSGMGAGCEFIKVARRGTADFANEARRLRWAAPYLAVPRVLGVGVDVSYGPRTGGKSKVSGSLRGSIIAILDFWKVIS